jgi:hypothetical protein
MKTSVTFETSDSALAELYAAAESVEKSNIRDFSGRKVLIEGGGYNGLWLETQPMGGEMYAKRNMEVALNNTLLFIEHQKPNGRFPGVIKYIGDEAVLTAQYPPLQGFCFAHHALNLYYWNKKRDGEYLRALSHALEIWDGYLWKYRDSGGDGCLESWCVWDTGEDNSERFTGTALIAGGWAGESPPDDAVFPVESMDVMGYSYDSRSALAKIAVILGTGKEGEWEKKARAVQEGLRARLWDETRGACFERDRNNKVMPTLVHNNLRGMYYGVFTREMAGRFVREHLFNPEEFFTPMPIPSIAIHDPVFRNNPGNDWNGQSEGLTWQRAIRALENYGFYKEIGVLGEKLIQTLGTGGEGKWGKFPQQFDPFTGAFSGLNEKGDYGPTALSALEYMSRLYGIHVQFDEIYWGCFSRGNHETVYTQEWEDDVYRLETKNGVSSGYINGRLIFTVNAGVRIVTDWEGSGQKVITV